MGIYFHIPFCKKACHYCDFHFSTSLKYKEELVQAMVQEIRLRKQEISNQTITTIYFGGGTPSLLSVVEINLLINTISEYNHLGHLQEITLEANPDDVDESFINNLRQTPVNRFSVGVQSFFNEDLLWMNRSHSAEQAVQAIKRLQQAGFPNLNIDLIYGSPTTTNEMWIENVEFWDKLNIPHLSAYALTVENSTALHSMIKQGKTKAPSDETTSFQFNFLMEYAKENGIDHYEISNFCKQNHYSQHNTNYWFNKAYVGIGPSAHSYNGSNIRRWNVANNIKYIEAVTKNQLFYEQEQLSETDQINEFILTRLRTKWGIEQKEFSARYGKDYWNKLLPAFEELEAKNMVIDHGNQYSLSQKGKHFADGIASDLFF